MTTAQPTLVRVLRRDRVVVLTALAVVTLLAWTYLVLGANVPMNAAPMAMAAAPWTPRYSGVMFVMWALMMVAMMLPGAAPMILLFAAISRRGHPGVAALRRTAVFGFAYVCVWVLFAAVATGLRHCRAPTGFLASHWRAGAAGALRMGVRHGLVCLGCCRVLMGLLFVGGAMNLLWIVALAVIVFVEKAIPRGKLAGRLVAVGLLAWGGAVLVFT